MRLTIHLFTADVTDVRDLVHAPEGGSHRFLEHKLPLDFPSEAVGVVRAVERPPWAGYLDEYFTIDWQWSASHSVALFAFVANRWFAVTFGHARHLLRTERLVADFGLRVTANAVPGDGLRSMSALTMDGAPRRTVQRVSVPSATRAFSIDLVGEWIYALGGWTDGELTRGVAGSQALAVELDPSRSHLKQLPDLLAHLLGRYGSSDYREHFRFIDDILPLPPTDQRIPTLNTALVARLQAGREFVVVEPAEQPGDDERLWYRLRGSRDRLNTMQVVNAAGRVRDPLMQRVETVDSRHVVIGTRTLREFLSAEFELPGGEYAVLAEGQWFVVNRDYVARLASDLARVPEWGRDRLDLPRWWEQHSEHTYNTAAAALRRWLLMDRRLFAGVVPQRDRVEVADLITPASDFVCVKRMRGAAGLSHLFSQGSVSAQLFAQYPEYREFVEDRFRLRWPEQEPSTPTIVFAIGLDRPRRLPTGLPFFSRVNLRTHVEAIRDHRLDVAMARIEITPFRKSPGIPRQRRHKESDEGSDQTLF